jgi:hypothetical protein
MNDELGRIWKETVAIKPSTAWDFAGVTGRLLLLLLLLLLN